MDVIESHDEKFDIIEKCSKNQAYDVDKIIENFMKCSKSDYMIERKKRNLTTKCLDSDLTEYLEAADSSNIIENVIRFPKYDSMSEKKKDEQK